MKRILAQGRVIKGFGRGSKELGIPTANFPDDVVSGLSDDLPTGIYFGWAKVDNGQVHKMVMSVGWNPFFKNEKKSMETHIMHKFERDFYDSWLRVLICGYIRPEKNFTSLDELIKAIESDIAKAEEELERDEFKGQMEDKFFTDPHPEDANPAAAGNDDRS